ncbi:MAG: hypothetical protein AAF092_05540 [Pseudomonadota bacterium]
MQDLTTITRNARTHGDFAGRTVQEQDAYFAFFAGDTEPLKPHAATHALHAVISLTLSSLRWRGPGVASPKGQT